MSTQQFVKKLERVINVQENDIKKLNDQRLALLEACRSLVHHLTCLYNTKERTQEIIDVILESENAINQASK